MTVDPLSSELPPVAQQGPLQKLEKEKTRRRIKKYK